MQVSAPSLPRQAGASALAGALEPLVAARTSEQVLVAALDGARRILPARGVAVGVLDPAAAAVEILDSWGYDCSQLAPGARVPLQTGLPICETARTARTVVRTAPGGGWISVPMPAGAASGALLVSLVPDRQVDLPTREALERLGVLVGVALARCADLERFLGALTGSRGRGCPAWADCAVLVRPRTGDLGGDVVEIAPHPDGSLWWVVADVCGSDAEAAAVGVAFRCAMRALRAYAEGPAELLQALDAALHAEPASRRFVTAVAGTARPTDAGMIVRLALAGHPPVRVVRHGRVDVVGTPTRPLNLDLAGPLEAVESRILLRHEELLLAHTDGLTDRLRANPDALDGEEALDALLARCAPLRDAAAVAEALTAALTATAGPARDDLALLVLRAVEPAG